MRRTILSCIVFTNIIALNLIFSDTSYSQSNYKPWGSRVRVGDENKKILTGSDSKSISINLRKTRRQSAHIHTVFNGLQGGAYLLLRFFQVVISPQDGPNCRFIPACSTYGKYAVEKHGALLGAIMAGERLIRCNPYYPPGYDRVPDTVFGD